jgi:PAS domain S-box-containing protein
MIKTFRNMGIQGRLFLLILIVLVPILLIEAIIYYERFQTRKAEELQANLELARAVGRTFDSFVADILHTQLAIGLAASASPPISKDSLLKMLHAVEAANPMLRSFTWISPEGIHLVTTNPTIANRKILEWDQFSRIESGGHRAVTPIFVSPYTGERVFRIFQGIGDPKGKLLGVVACTAVADKLDPLLAFQRSKGAGISLIDSKGVHVYRYPFTPYTPEQKDWLKQYPMIQDALKGKEATAEVLGPSGEKRLVGFVPIPSIGWVVAASRAEEEVMAAFISRIFSQALLTLIITLAAFGAALVFSRPISRSIIRLRTHALALGRGEVEEIAPASGPGEIKDLSAAFDQMVEEVDLRGNALRQSEERYRRLVELSPLMIMVHQQSRYVYANPAAVKALGASSAEELLGKSVFDVIHPDCWNIVRERIRVLESGEVAPAIEERFIRFDNKEIDVEVTNVQSLYQDEPVILVIGRDITKQKKAEKEKAALQEKLQQAQKMEAIGTLAGGIAHDFNNILAAIIGYAELAGLDIGENTKAKYNLQQSMKAALRAKDLVHQILTFSRQGSQDRKPLDIRPIVKEGLKFLRSSLPATVEIRQEMDKDLGVLEGDPTQVYQVLMNLCTNAAHAMEEKGGVLEVSLANVDANGKTLATNSGIGPGPYVRLRVGDTGHGIPAEIRERIFDPYFTTKEVGKGTGLGLAVVHGIVESCGGGIAVSSEVGKGSVFDVYFPRIEAAKSPSAADRVEPLPRDGHERVLFVDDEKAIAEIGKDVLEYLGYKVEVRTSSVEALEVFRAKPDHFDLVITDMTMPNMTGDKLAQEMIRIRPGIPIILSTGFSERITEENARAMGIREFVMKPLVIKELAQVMRRALDSRERKKG